MTVSYCSNSTCTTPDKVSFGTLRGAAVQMIFTYENYGVWQRPYRCECGEYHLTTNDLNGQPVTAAQAEALIDAVV